MAKVVQRPFKVTLTLTSAQQERLGALAEAMGQSVSVAAGVCATLGLNALEGLYSLSDPLKLTVKAAMEQHSEGVVNELIDAGLPVKKPEE